MVSLSLEEVKQATGIDELEVNAIGQIRFHRGLTLSVKKRHLKQTNAVYRRKDIGWRFLIGNMINDLRLPYGQKRGYCLDAFGEQAGKTNYGYANTAAHWNDERQDYNIPWSLFKDAGLLTSELKKDLVKRFTAKEWNLDKCRKFCRDWKEENLPRNSQGISSDGKIGQKQRNSLLPIPTPNNREFLEVMRAVRYAPTIKDAIALRNAADLRLVELEAAECEDAAAEVEEVEEEEDDFADSSYWDAQG